MADQATPERRLAQLPAPSSALVTIRYERAAEVLRTMIASAIRRNAIGTANQRTKQLAAVNRVLDRLRTETAGLGSAGVREGYLSGALAADLAVKALVPDDEAAKLLEPEFKFASGANTAQVIALQLAAENKLAAAVRTVGRSVDDVFREVALEEVATAAAAGLGRRETSSNMVNKFADQGIKAFTDRAGRKWKLNVYARMVARTTQREAASLGTVDRALQVGLDLVTVSKHHTDVDICTPYEGKTYSLTGKTKGYERIKTFPPFHPNCKHVLTIAAENFELLSGIRHVMA